MTAEVPPPVDPSVEPESGAPAGPTAEQVAERSRRANRATRGALAANLCLEALIVLLVPRTIAHTSTGIDTWKSVLLIVLAMVLVAVGAMLRRPWGIGAGSVLQVVVLATGFWVHAMFFLGVVFIVIWLYTLNLRHDLVGTPGGVRMLGS